eukprot:COSAG06_NODE_7121_length_2623_cov_18.988906_2_plen_178_part_01
MWCCPVLGARRGDAGRSKRIVAPRSDSGKKAVCSESRFVSRAGQSTFLMYKREPAADRVDRDSPKQVKDLERTKYYLGIRVSTKPAPCRFEWLTGLLHSCIYRGRPFMVRVVFRPTLRAHRHPDSQRNHRTHLHQATAKGNQCWCGRQRKPVLVLGPQSGCLDGRTPSWQRNPSLLPM